MKSKFKIWHLILLLSIVGFIFRIYFLGEQSFWIDEAFSVNAAKGIMAHGYPLLDSGVVYSRAILNTYIIAFFMQIFGETQFSARLVSVLFGTLMIPLMYYFGKELGNKKIGIIAAVLVTFSVWEIAWSRQARMYQQLQFFYFLSLLFFYRFSKKFDIKNAVFLTLSTIAALFSHRLGFTLPIIFLIYFIVISLYDKSQLKQLRSLYGKALAFAKKKKAASLAFHESVLQLLFHKILY